MDGSGEAMTVPLRMSRRRPLLDSAGIAVSVGGFGIAYGVAAHDAGMSIAEASSMSILPFAGASQFAAVGYLTQGLGWAVIVALTALLNARHLLYSASLAPRLRELPLRRRMLMAHFLTDEAFALSSTHFARLGRTDAAGYWIAALVATFVPWNIGTVVGMIAGGAVADPSMLGLDVVFPAAMGGLAVGLVTGRRELVAAASGGVIGVGVALAGGTGLGVVVGGLVGPLVAFAVPAKEDLVTLILLAVLMFAVTYPARVLPIAVPVLDKLPGPVLTYLRLVGPAVLTALAVVNSVVDDERALHLGSTALCVVVCVALVAWRRNLLLGLIVAIGLAVALRALGLD